MLTLMVNLALPRTVAMAHTGRTSNAPWIGGLIKRVYNLLGPV